MDDGANDSSPAICDEYAAQDSRITVIHQENGGIAKAQNAGLDAARGEYIAFADNDDILDRCNIEYLQSIRDNHTEDYFFTYPEDYADSINDWDNGQMKPLTIHPAFELIFFYQQELGTLELYCPALKSNKQIKTCQEIFCQVVLGIDLPEQSKQKSYEISPMLSSDFSFDFSPQETGIKEVFIKELYVEFLRDKQEKVRISADTTNNKNAVYDFLTMIKNSFQPEPPPMNLISAEVRAVFMDDSSKDFTIGCKNSCNLGLTEQDRILKQVLIDSNIQLTQ